MVTLIANDRLGDEPQAGGGIKKFLRTGGGSTVGPSALSRNSSSAVGGRRGGEIHATMFVYTAASGNIICCRLMPAFKEYECGCRSTYSSNSILILLYKSLFSRKGRAHDSR